MMAMEEDRASPFVSDGRIRSIMFSAATDEEIVMCFMRLCST